MYQQPHLDLGIVIPQQFYPRMTCFSEIDGPGGPSHEPQKHGGPAIEKFAMSEKIFTRSQQIGRPEEKLGRNDNRNCVIVSLEVI